MNRLIVLALAVLALPAQAAITVTAPFEFDGTSFGGADVKDITAADFSYSGEVDFSGNNFAFTGVAFVGSFRKNLAAPPIPSTGLGDKYNLYLKIEGNGTRTALVPGV